jgi:hypothetical protein
MGGSDVSEHSLREREREREREKEKREIGRSSCRAAGSRARTASGRVKSGEDGSAKEMSEASIPLSSTYCRRSCAHVTGRASHSGLKAVLHPPTTVKSNIHGRQPSVRPETMTPHYGVQHARAWISGLRAARWSPKARPAQTANAVGSSRPAQVTNRLKDGLTDRPTDGPTDRPEPQSAMSKATGSTLAVDSRGVCRGGECRHEGQATWHKARAHALP